MGSAWSSAGDGVAEILGLQGAVGTDVGSRAANDSKFVVCPGLSSARPDVTSAILYDLVPPRRRAALSCRHLDRGRQPGRFALAADGKRHACGDELTLPYPELPNSRCQHAGQMNASQTAYRTRTAAVARMITAMNANSLLRSRRPLTT